MNKVLERICQTTEIVIKIKDNYGSKMQCYKKLVAANKAKKQYKWN